MEGTVTSADGSPAAGVVVRVAEYRGGAYTVEHAIRTDPTGHWAMHVIADPRVEIWAQVDAIEGVEIAAGPRAPKKVGMRIHADLRLPATRRVVLGCAGLEGDRCSTLEMDMMECGPSGLWSPTVGWVARGKCNRDVLTGCAWCACPAGPATIIADEQAVAVPAGLDQAWLDYRSGYGEVIGVVEPPPGVGPETCAIFLRPQFNIWTGVWTPRPMTHTFVPGPDGRFSVKGVAAGEWELVLGCDGAGAKVTPLEIGSDVSDVGTISL